ncbi:hypothetical protein [Bacillus sp. FJAT-29814]|uniref:hypothetical protein n=1 Tax=Bacillus sp. FJAT-29814 TaxID=1729688 RepID=UPI000AE279FE|nr:hypothetical protein [Bacillus sp. FJAT-29814]
MSMQRSPFDSKQQMVQKIYRETLYKKRTKKVEQNEKRDISLFIGFVIFGFFLLAIFEQFL